MNKNYVWIAIGLVVFLGLSAYVLLDDSGDDGYPSHTVTYVGNGGVLSDGSDTYVKTTSRAADCEFSNPGYVFVTWSTVPDASGPRYDDGGVFKDDDVRVLYAIGGGILSKVIHLILIQMPSIITEMSQFTLKGIMSDGI